MPRDRPRELEKEIDALLQAKSDQIPLWHEVVDRALVASVQQGLQLAFALLEVHREVMLRTAASIPGDRSPRQTQQCADVPSALQQAVRRRPRCHGRA